MASHDSPDDEMLATAIEEQRFIDDNGQEQVEVTVAPSN
jgi:hypothetical protein